MAIDGAGNLYIADNANHRIRKVSTCGIITTVAGTGTADFGGDGGNATQATLNGPVGVALDIDGNMFISDINNGRIRKVNTSGIISTVAGGGTTLADGIEATTAKLQSPSGIALDATGNLFIADQVNNRIRKVNPSGIISTVAGSAPFTPGFSGDGGSATSVRLFYPIGLAVDEAGNVFFADYGNERIRMVNTSGIISTIAGGGSSTGDETAATSVSLAGPTAVAINGTGRLLIAELDNNRIRRFTIGGIISTVAGNGSTTFGGDGGSAVETILNSPVAIAADAAGNFFIADGANNRIRKVNVSDGTISTVAGTGSATASGDGGSALNAGLRPSGLAFDAAGNLYIAERFNHRIRKVTIDGIISTVAGTGTAGFLGDNGLATSARLNEPLAIAVDGAGNLYIADRANNRIRKVDKDGFISTIAGTGTAGFSGDGDKAKLAQLNKPNNVAVDGAGNLYFSDDANNRIRKINADGAISTVVGNGTGGFGGDGGEALSASLHSPYGVAIDALGNIFIADLQNHRIRKVLIHNNRISTVAGKGGPSFSGDGGAATSANINQPTGVFVDAAGNLFIADRLNNRIRKVTVGPAPTIIIGTIPGICPGSASFQIPFTNTTNDPDQYRVTGVGINNEQTGSLSGSSGVITVNIDPTTFTGSYTLLVSNTTTGAISSPISGSVAIEHSLAAVTSIVTGTNPQAISTPFAITATVSSPGNNESVTVNWGDGTSSVASVLPDGRVSATRSYSAAGVYVIQITAKNVCGVTVPETFKYAVVYDPSAGFVTGGGWINSPAGAYSDNPALTGVATFGFVARYQKGATKPTGNTDFQFEAGALSFKSTAYEWLTVAGARAQFKGTGTINGADIYSFMLTAVDGQVNGGGNKDKFRIKIWNGAGVFYDNKMGATDDYDITQDNNLLIGGGSIMVHTTDSKKAREGLEPVLTADALVLRNYPNPVEGQTSIEFMLPQGGAYSLDIQDLKGALVRHLKAGQAQAGEVQQVNWEARQKPAGLYIGRLTTEHGVKAIRMLVK
ncbi:hypothetical protein GCM10023189_18770 [Nibrella saemangeumensis]|uniref:Teneurin NHL domain-containing protein n=1 Tax=Nibrella saemangeumensis TaxID=1084526 RepID=A0ABP8MSF4_9BACT